MCGYINIYIWPWVIKSLFPYFREKNCLAWSSPARPGPTSGRSSLALAWLSPRRPWQSPGGALPGNFFSSVPLPEMAYTLALLLLLGLRTSERKLDCHGLAWPVPGPALALDHPFRPGAGPTQPDPRQAQPGPSCFCSSVPLAAPL